MNKYTICALIGLFFLITLMSASGDPRDVGADKVAKTIHDLQTAPLQEDSSVIDSVVGDTIYGNKCPPEGGDDVPGIPNGWYIYICPNGDDYAVLVENGKIKYVGGGPGGKNEFQKPYHLVYHIGHSVI